MSGDTPVLTHRVASISRANSTLRRALLRLHLGDLLCDPVALRRDQAREGPGGVEIVEHVVVRRDIALLAVDQARQHALVETVEQ